MTDLSLFYADLYYVLPVFTVDTVVFWQQSLSLGIHWFARTWSVATKSVQCPRVTCHYPFTWRRSTKHATYRSDAVNIYIYLKAGLHGYQVFRVDSMSLSSSIELARTGLVKDWLGQDWVAWTSNDDSACWFAWVHGHSRRACTMQLHEMERLYMCMKAKKKTRKKR